jgi:hypothetical protein
MKTEYSLMIWMYILVLNFPISEGSGRLSLSRYSPIATGWTRNDEGEKGHGGEVRKFEFDFAHYKHCKLPRRKPFFVKKYNIKKGDKHFEGNEVEENIILFIAGLNKDTLAKNDPPETAMRGHHIAIRYCSEKSRNMMMTSDAEDVGEEGDKQPANSCGLATTLSYLCYLDKEFEPSIKDNSRIGYDFATEIQSGDLKLKKVFEEIKMWAKYVCKWTLKVFNVQPDPRAGGKAYIYAAMDAGYDIFVVLDEDKEAGYLAYDIKEVVEEFQTPGWMNNFVEDHLRLDWFFCKKNLGPPIYNP